MQEKLQLLKDLQEIDQDLRQLRTTRQALEEEQAALGADLEKVQTMVDALCVELERIEGERKELSLALTQEKDNVEKAESRLPEIKTQKEYVAVLKEIDTAKKMNKDLQDRIAAKDSEAEEINREKQEKDTQLLEVKERVGGRVQEIQEQLDGFEKAYSEKKGNRDSFLKQLKTPMRKRYELLLDRRAGVAVVEARNGTCQGCNMHLPPQLFNSLYTVEEIQSCPHCNRMLYVLPPA